MTIHDPTHLYEGEISPGAEKAARAVSIVTHAPFLAAITFVLLSLKADDPVLAVESIIISLLTATVIPVVAVQHYSVKFGNTDGDVVRREDRTMPLVCGIVCYAVGAVLLYLIDAPWIVTVTMLVYAISTVVVILITTRWKISIHATGVMGPALAITIAYWPWGLVFFLLLPLVAWARYVRRKHTPAQLVGGALEGLIVTGLIFWLLL